MRERCYTCECGARRARNSYQCRWCAQRDHAVRTWREVARIWRAQSGQRVSDMAIKEAGQHAMRKLRRLLLADPVIREHMGLPPLDEQPRHLSGIDRKERWR
jgi:hypothetical protein